MSEILFFRNFKMKSAHVRVFLCVVACGCSLDHEMLNTIGKRVYVWVRVCARVCARVFLGLLTPYSIQHLFQRVLENKNKE